MALLWREETNKTLRGVNMKVKDVIYHVANLVSMTDVATILDIRELELSQGETYTFSSSEYSKLKKVTDAITSALERISREYVPFVATEIVRSDSEGRVAVNSLQKNVHRVVSAFAVQSGAKSYVTDDGNTIKLERPNTSYYLKYHFVPSGITVADLDKDLSMPFCISRVVLSYAVARDLALLSTCYDEAEVWDRKMQESLKRSLSPAREIKIGRRKFL